jgi:hypothetical protein
MEKCLACTRLAFFPFSRMKKCLVVAMHYSYLKDGKTPGNC